MSPSQALHYIQVKSPGAQDFPARGVPETETMQNVYEKIPAEKNDSRDIASHRGSQMPGQSNAWSGMKRRN